MRYILRIFSVLFFWLYSHFALAYNVSPLSVNAEYYKNSNVVIDNSASDKPLHFTTKTFLRTVDIDGKNIRTINDEDILIIPPQGIVPAGGKQSVMIRYIGDADPSESKHYYVTFSQIKVNTDPVEVENNIEGVTTKIQFAFAYDIAVNFSISGKKFDISIDDLKIYQGKDKKTGDPLKYLSFTAENIGERYIYIDDLNIALDMNGQQYNLPSTILRQVKNSPLLPTSVKRNFTIPLHGLNIPIGTGTLIFK